jgi:hypothetical protein
MALQSSGTISIGGSTSGRSINLELNRSATATSSLDESALRSLANRSSGSISLSHFYGKSNALETQVVNVGYQAGGTYTPSFYGTGFSGIAIMNNSLRDTGNCTDGTLAVRSNKYIVNLRWQGSGSNAQVLLQIMNNGSNITNAGFTTMNIAGTSYQRSSATFAHSTGTGAGTSAGQSSFTSWTWSSSSNPFGTTTGVNKTVSFS